MEGKIHFKITHGGVTRRFAISRTEEDLLPALKARVEKMTGSNDLPLFWKDEDSLIVLESKEDMEAAVDYAETKNKLACVSLETGDNKKETREEAEKVEIKIVTAVESAAAFDGFSFMCNVCDCYLAPSNGGRYKCTICDDYDLCAACITKGEHDNHAFVLLRDGDTEVPLKNEAAGVLSMRVKDATRCTPTFVAVTPSADCVLLEIKSKTEKPAGEMINEIVEQWIAKDEEKIRKKKEAAHSKKKEEKLSLQKTEMKKPRLDAEKELKVRKEAMKVAENLLACQEKGRQSKNSMHNNQKKETTNDKDKDLLEYSRNTMIDIGKRTKTLQGDAFTTAKNNNILSTDDAAPEMEEITPVSINRQMHDLEEHQPLFPCDGPYPPGLESRMNCRPPPGIEHRGPQGPPPGLVDPTHFDHRHLVFTPMPPSFTHPPTHFPHQFPPQHPPFAHYSPPACAQGSQPKPCRHPTTRPVWNSSPVEQQKNVELAKFNNGLDENWEFPRHVAEKKDSAARRDGNSGNCCRFDGNGVAMAMFKNDLYENREFPTEKNTADKKDKNPQAGGAGFGFPKIPAFRYGPDENWEFPRHDGTKKKDSPRGGKNPHCGGRGFGDHEDGMLAAFWNGLDENWEFPRTDGKKKPATARAATRGDQGRFVSGFGNRRDIDRRRVVIGADDGDRREERNRDGDEEEIKRLNDLYDAKSREDDGFYGRREGGRRCEERSGDRYLEDAVKRCDLREADREHALDRDRGGFDRDFRMSDREERGEFGGRRGRGGSFSGFRGGFRCGLGDSRVERERGFNPFAGRGSDEDVRLVPLPGLSGRGRGGRVGRGGRIIDDEFNRLTGERHSMNGREPQNPFRLERKRADDSPFAGRGSAEDVAPIRSGSGRGGRADSNREAAMRRAANEEDRSSRMRDEQEKAYKQASQIPAHMAIDVIEEMQKLQVDVNEIEKKLTEYMDHLINNICLKPHPRVFKDVTTHYENQMLGNIAIDLGKHLRGLRKFARTESHRACMRSFEKRRKHLVKALLQLGTEGKEYEEFANELRPILLTSDYTGYTGMGGNWDEIATGFMEGDVRRRFAPPPRVASADPDMEGLLAPIPFNCVPTVETATATSTQQLNKEQKGILGLLIDANMFGDYDRMVEVSRSAKDIHEAMKMMIQ